MESVRIRVVYTLKRGTEVVTAGYSLTLVSKDVQSRSSQGFIKSPVIIAAAPIRRERLMSVPAIAAVSVADVM